MLSVDSSMKPIGEGLKRLKEQMDLKKGNDEMKSDRLDQGIKQIEEVIALAKQGLEVIQKIKKELETTEVVIKKDDKIYQGDITTQALLEVKRQREEEEAAKTKRSEDIGRIARLFAKSESVCNLLLSDDTRKALHLNGVDEILIASAYRRLVDIHSGVYRGISSRDRSELEARIQDIANSTEHTD